MTDFEYEKQLIGIMLGFERKRNFKCTHDPKYKQSNIINLDRNQLLEFCNSCLTPCKRNKICSVPTIKKIEHGYYFSNDCYYFGLAFKLGYKYRLNKNDITILDNITNLVYNILEKKENFLIDDFFNLTDLYNDLKEYLFFSQLINIYISLISLMSKLIVPPDYIIELAKIIESSLKGRQKVIINYFLSLYYSKCNSISDLNTKYREQALSSINDKSFLKEELRIFLYLNNNELLSSYNCLVRLSKKKCLLKNNYAQIFIYSHLTFLSLNLNFKSINNYLPHYQYLVKQYANLYPDIMIDTFYNQLAIVNYFSEDYFKSSIYFHKVLNNNINLMVYNIFLYYDAIKKSNYEPGYNTFNSNFKALIIEPANKLAYTYFIKKFSYTLITKEIADLLEDYILTNLKSIYPKDSRHYKLLYSELKDLVKISKNYKKLAILNES